MRTVYYLYFWSKSAHKWKRFGTFTELNKALTTARDLDSYKRKIVERSERNVINWEAGTIKKASEDKKNYKPELI